MTNVVCSVRGATYTIVPTVSCLSRISLFELKRTQYRGDEMLPRTSNTWPSGRFPFSRKSTVSKSRGTVPGSESTRTKLREYELVFKISFYLKLTQLFDNGEYFA